MDGTAAEETAPAAQPVKKSIDKAVEKRIMLQARSLMTADVLTDNWPANDELTIDELTFKIYHTPGHTGGGVCLSCYGLLFSGDTLFAGSCGRTDFPGGSMQEMAKSLSLLAELPLPDATKVLPGHEGFSTLGQERSTNPYMNGAWY